MFAPGSRLLVFAAALCVLSLAGCPPEDESPDPPPIPEPEIEETSTQ